ncbi:MAG: preprotein translocase subunit SecA [Candidatus Ratteibacteria bacterium]|nr:preprotein translocase subunit SecA [Candidatus Ratteibacteria bacterium]
MLNFIISKLSKSFGTKSERDIKKLMPQVLQINALEPEISRLSDEQLRSKTDVFREHVQKKNRELEPEIKNLETQIRESVTPEGKRKLKEKLKLARNKIFDDILAETFAVVREVSRRTIKMRHFDVQLAGGIVLHQGKIAEMATGEGKTLVATLPMYLNALLGQGAHLITVNDYLARRDRDWMGPVYEFLGLSVGVIQHDMFPPERKQAYNCDITYGTNNEFGFDYLRDNMAVRKEDCVQRPLHYAIVDEVDSILVDEARTPLIISGPAEESTNKYYKLDRIFSRLNKGKRDEESKQESGDYIVDEKANTTYLTEEGEIKVARFLGLKDLHSIETMAEKKHAEQMLKAHCNFRRDVDYMVKDDQVIIVDEFTGRLMPGRRYSDGLHQALEAKEGVKIERENQTLATITFQNYFRLYEKLAGMTGTAETEAREFLEIYNLDVVVTPPNRTLIRHSSPDIIYKTEKEKFRAVINEIEEMHQKGRPVLIGTVSIETSERLSGLLKQRGLLDHSVLNARYHEKEAEIVSMAGQRAAVTIATNMAGRGTDIVLGEGVAKIGGLHIIGTERHEARRIDNQLRGRAGRQGDPGSSCFYLSLDDNLLRIFGSERLGLIMDKLGMEENQPITHILVTRAIETAQRRVEGQNFDIRKHILEYDNVMNKQREIIYSQRQMVLEGKNLREHIEGMMADAVDGLAELYLEEKVHPEDWNLDGFEEKLKNLFGLDFNFQEIDPEKITRFEIKEKVLAELKDYYRKKEKRLGEKFMRHLERMMLLQTVDNKWKDHLYTMDSLREGIGLRAYGQRDPLVEYQKEAHLAFQEMIKRIKFDALEYLYKIEVVERPERVPVAAPQADLVHDEYSSFKAPPPETGGRKEKREIRPVEPYKRKGEKVGRNDPCPCGSGKKYKKCCGRT